MRRPRSALAAGVLLLLTASCARDAAVRRPEAPAEPAADAEALAALESTEEHATYSLPEFWSLEARKASSLWGRAYQLCLHVPEGSRTTPSCRAVLVIVAATYSQTMDRLLRRVQAADPKLPSPPRTPRLP